MVHIPTPAYGKLILVAALVGAAVFGWWAISPSFIINTVSEPLMEGAGPPVFDSEAQTRGAGGESFTPLTYRAGAFVGLE